MGSMPARTGTAMIIIMTEREQNALALLRLQSWLSPTFPVGAYSYSHGLEYAVEAGLITDVATLTEWLGGDLQYGAGYNDALLFAAAYRAVSDQDICDFIEVAELANALRGSYELALESQAQGRAFLSTVWRAWPHDEAEKFARPLRERNIAVAYPVAVALACALHAAPLAGSLQLFLQASIGNLINAGVRLIPLGQTDGQKAAAALESADLQVAGETLEGDLEKLGSAAMMIDWSSMQHETQYTRLFRS